MFKKVEREAAIDSDFTDWKKMMESSRIYDLLIVSKFKSEVISCMWLPFKSINIDNNNTVFKLLVAKHEAGFGYSLNIAEVIEVANSALVSN